MKAAIRLDDITVNMDWERFRCVEAILDEADICPLIGVVPFPEDINLDRMGSGTAFGSVTYKPRYSWDDTITESIPSDDGEWSEFLKGLKDKGWVIALHGYKHVYTTRKKGIFPLNRFSEFAGISFYDQLNMIKKGLDKLESWGVPAEVFMAPGHTYDRKTLKALCGAGLMKVTDGFGARPYRRFVHNAGRVDVLRFYPISRKRSECISDKYGFTTLVLHCNTMTDDDMDALKQMIMSNRDHFMNYGEYLTEGLVDRGVMGNIGEYLTAYCKYIYVKLRRTKTVPASADRPAGRTPEAKSAAVEAYQKRVRKKKAKKADSVAKKPEAHDDDEDDDDFITWIE